MEGSNRLSISLALLECQGLIVLIVPYITNTKPLPKITGTAALFPSIHVLTITGPEHINFKWAGFYHKFYATRHLVTINLNNNCFGIICFNLAVTSIGLHNIASLF